MHSQKKRRQNRRAAEQLPYKIFGWYVEFESRVTQSIYPVLVIAHRGRVVYT